MPEPTLLAPAGPQTATDDRTAKRDSLLRGAVAMFNERGFHATSLGDVSASLGVSKPMIYYYLGNKDLVLLECVRVGLTQLQVAADEACARPGRGVDRLEAFLRHYAEVIMGDFGRCIIRTADEALSPSGRQEFRRLKRQIDHTLRTMIGAAIADGSIRPVDVRLAAFSAAGALNWIARWHVTDGPMPPERIAHDMVDLLIGGLRPPTGSGL